MILILVFRHYKLEADLANMTWKVAWEDLQSTKLGARGQFGSRFSLGRMSLAEMVKFKSITSYTHQVVFDIMYTSENKLHSANFLLLTK